MNTPRFVVSRRHLGIVFQALSGGTYRAPNRPVMRTYIALHIALVSVAACGPGNVTGGPFDSKPNDTTIEPAPEEPAFTDTDPMITDQAPTDTDATDTDPGNGVIDPGFDIDGRATIGPDFESEGLEDRDNVPHGSIHRFTMKSDDSTLYPGLNGDYSRAVEVYVPAQYQDGDLAPFIVVQDGPGYTDRMRRALDNLIADKRVPVLIAIMVANGGGDSIGSERGLEYDTMSDRYVRFVDSEVLPAVKAALADDYPSFALTDDPEGRATMGCSSGAAAAFTMAWFGDDRYRRVLSYSGTFVDQQDPAVPTFTNGAWEYHEHLISDGPKKPIRVYLEVGEKDLRYNDPESTLHNWVMANNRMADDLEDQHYHFRYDFALGAGHCDSGAIGQTLSGALAWLWAGYPVD